MSFNYSPKIITNGLVYYIDPSNTKSYIGTGTTCLDLTPSASTTTLVGGVTFSGNSFGFDGTNTYLTPNTSSLGNFSGDYTADIWFKINTMGNNYYPLLCKRDPSNSDFTTPLLLNIDNRTGVNTTAINWSLGNSASSIFQISIQNTITANTWTNINCVVSGTSMTLYKNGITLTATTFTGTRFTNNALMYIGENNGFSPKFLGRIGQIKLYNRALSAANILQNYNTIKYKYIT